MVLLWAFTFWSGLFLAAVSGSHSANAVRRAARLTADERRDVLAAAPIMMSNTSSLMAVLSLKALFLLLPKLETWGILADL